MAENSNRYDTRPFDPACNKTLKLDHTAKNLINDTPANSEVQHDFAFNNPKLEWDRSKIIMDSFDVDELLREDAINEANKAGPYRFGNTFDVNYSLDNSGQWQTEADGDRIWALEFESADAYSMNLFFEEFNLPAGATLLVYDATQQHVLDFTHEDNNTYQTLTTWPLPGSTLSIEYHEPADVAGEGSLKIGSVIHGYKDIPGTIRGKGDSGSCNNNTICYDQYDTIIDPVAMIVVGGVGYCTGALINNVNNDATPYFLTANHCTNGSEENWTFRFNWESDSCATNSWGNGNNYDTVSGSQLVASSPGSDFALLLLDDFIPLSFDPIYAGWDSSGNTSDYTIGVHHPSGDIKKISFDNDAPISSDYGDATTWNVAEWDDGTTEMGSSGSPLYDPDGRIIGQLYGGDASCSDNYNDHYGKFSTTYHNSQAVQDALGNATFIDYYDPNEILVDYDIQLLSISSPSGSSCNAQSAEIIIRNAGTQTINHADITYSYSTGEFQSGEMTMSWDGTLLSTETASINLEGIEITNGQSIFSATVSIADDANPNNNTQQSEFNIGSGAEMTVNILTDNYPQETSWVITSDTSSDSVMSGAGLTETNTLYSWSECLLPSDTYTFTIIDNLEDGICCAYGIGSYELLLDGVSIAQGGAFTQSESVNFTIESGGIEGCTHPNANNYHPDATIEDGSCTYNAGDLNEDGVVDIVDAIVLVNMILDMEACPPEGDLNDSGKCDVLDVITIINIIVDSRDDDESVDEDNIF